MGKILATYFVKITIKDTEEGKEPSTPTNYELEEIIANAIKNEYSHIEVNASSERTDK